MKYTINPEALFSTFPLPCAAVDKHIKLANELQLKVLLCAMRSLTEGIETEKIAALLSKPESDVDDALLFWQQSEILLNNTPQEKKAPTEKPIVKKNARPTREDVANRGLEDPKVRFLMQEAQLMLGHNLKSNEASVILWLYDDQGMDISVIMLLLQYAVNEKRSNISFIENTAVYWQKKGVETVSDAEAIIAETARMKTSWHIIEGIFGIERRNPSTKELELSDLWLNKRKHSRELLKFAYDTCIDSISKLSIPYIAKLLEKWHADGYKTPDDVKKGQAKKDAEKQNSTGFAAYDLDAFEQMLNKDQ